MKSSYFVLTPDRHPSALNVVGTQVTVLAPNAVTQSYGNTLQRGDEARGRRRTATTGTRRSMC